MPAELPTQHGVCWDFAAQTSQDADSAGAGNISDSNAGIVPLVQAMNLTNLSCIVHQQVVSCDHCSTHKLLS